MAKTEDKVVIQLLTTGGTIAKAYNEGDGSLDVKDQSINKVLKKLRLPHNEVVKYPLMRKDSLFLGDKDRDKISGKIAELIKNNSPVVVLHGTDTMEVTAKYCLEQTKNPGVAVIFTGAMKPVEMEDSDALQNIAEAFIAARILPAGFYLSFHGSIFKVPHVRKNRDKSTFESI